MEDVLFTKCMNYVSKEGKACGPGLFAGLLLAFPARVSGKTGRVPTEPRSCALTVIAAVPPGGSDGKESARFFGFERPGFDPCVGKIPWRREWEPSPLQYSCLENPVDRGAWWVTVHKVANSRTPLSN